MKKLKTLLTALTMLTMTACASPAETTVSSAEEVLQKDEKVLVVYYSATGTTKQVGDTIAQTLNADVFEIEPVEPYTTEDLRWTNPESRVSVEHDNPDQRDVQLVSTEVENWEAYEVVFIGYPIWWQNASWVVDNFVKENDFTGKTVIPFATSQSSGFADSGRNLANLTTSGNWVDGQRFSSSSSEEEIQKWAIGALQ